MVSVEFKDLFLELCVQREQGLISWGDVTSQMNIATGESYSADRYRKDWSRNKSEYGILKSNTDELSEIDEKMIELQKERVKKQTIATKYNAIVREEARRELLFDEFKKSVEKLTNVEPPKFNRLTQSTGSQIALLGISDIHYGKKFKSVNNEYNIDIAKYRLEQTMSETIDYCDKNSINELHILNNADSVEGMSLRISQLQALELGFTDQVIEFTRLINHWLNEFSRYIKITYHHVRSANHTEIRPQGSKAGAFPAEDMEKIIGEWTYDLLFNNERIDVRKYNTEYSHFKIFDYSFLARHGNKIKNLKTYLRDISVLHKTFYDYLILGHVHHSEELSLYEGDTNNRSCLILPSIMGSDDFSDEILTGSKAGASLFIITDGKGKTDTHDIILN